jgi:hypothetical protein
MPCHSGRVRSCNCGGGSLSARGWSGTPGDVARVVDLQLATRVADGVCIEPQQVGNNRSRDLVSERSQRSGTSSGDRKPEATETAGEVRRVSRESRLLAGEHQPSSAVIAVSSSATPRS